MFIGARGRDDTLPDLIASAVRMYGAPFVLTEEAPHVWAPGEIAVVVAAAASVADLRATQQQIGIGGLVIGHCHAACLSLKTPARIALRADKFVDPEYTQSFLGLCKEINEGRDPMRDHAHKLRH